MKRLCYLDNLKVCLTVLVIMHHAGQAYGNGGGWAYTPSNPAEFMPWIWHFFSTNAAFFMGLYFFISGYFVPRSFDKQGTKQFVHKKLLRLGVPLLFMGGIISILSGKPEIGHMWFVESLLVFCLIYALIRQWVQPVNEACYSKPTIIGLLVVALLMGVGSYVIRQISPQDHWIWPFGIIPLPMEPAHYLQYVMMFVLGILAYRFQWLDKMSNSVGFMALLIGIALAMGNYLRDGGPWDAFVWQWFGIYESLMCVFISFGLIWLFREFVSTTSRFWQWCAAQSYGAYMFHLLLMIVLQNAMDSIWIGAFGKFLFIGVVTTVLSFHLTWMVKMIPGFKKVL
ncbi:MAG: acyltransferase [Prevotella sp.]|jgi:peptidoglycan/LPS O-acetylase OafA/YrhL|nr:acyltransferase [Prevotella sp.]